MALTKEELMKPRYKVVNTFPGMSVKLGQILEWERGIALFYQYQVDYCSYPHLFKSLHWWEERKESDMPEYLKYVVNDETKAVHKVVSYEGSNIVGQPLVQILCSDPNRRFYDHALDSFLPATQSEYDQYIKQKR